MDTAPVRRDSIGFQRRGGHEAESGCQRHACYTRAALDLLSPLVAAAGSTAFVAGLTGSLHCGLMCGPLACASLGRGSTSRMLMASWHLGRVLAYATVGLLLGGVGHGLSLALTFSVQPYLPWVMALGLVVTALDLARFVKPLPGVARVSKALVRAGSGLPPAGRAFALGAATPFLPCGLLYGVFLAALATDSAAGGGLVMLSFSLGAVPVLSAVQLGARGFERWPTTALVLRRAVPLVAAAVLVARALLARDATPDCH
jgi:sulfite exporter TauE/SafE